MDFQPTSSKNVANISKVHERIRKTICCCCLAANRPVVNLITCTHAAFLQDFFNMDNFSVAVCLLCHNMLRKIQIFQNQVRESFMVLKKQIPHTTVPKIHNLYTSRTNTFTVSENSVIELENTCEILKSKSELPSNRVSLEFLTDVKIEHDSTSSDFENDLPLSQVKKSKQKKPKTKFPTDNKYKGKIMIYNLNKEELEEERDKESKKESYLKLPFKCHSCVKGFDHENTLKNHNDKQHTQKKGGIQCDVCKTILGPISYKEHARRHYRRFQCVACGKRAQDIYSISQHYNRQHEAGAISQQFQCNLCDFTTESNRKYRYHRDKHKQKQQCNVCGNTYVSVYSLRVHMLKHATNKQSGQVYCCSFCDKSYSSKSGLHNHHASAHSNAGAYCAPCHAHFRTKSGLAHHLRTHSAHLTPNNKKFQCNVCDAKFLTKRALQTHIDWDHLKTIKHECTKCSKVFKSAVTLRNHNSYVHERRRPPRDKICDYCGRGFTTTAILRCHIRTHTGERPLHCSRCNAAFAHSSALYTHTKLLHKQIQ